MTYLISPQVLNAVRMRDPIVGAITTGKAQLVEDEETEEKNV